MGTQFNFGGPGCGGVALPRQSEEGAATEPTSKRSHPISFLDV
jgi:hypothetical protein